MGDDYGHYQNDFLSLHIEYPLLGSWTAATRVTVTSETSLELLFKTVLKVEE
jgi:hypothetical protein